MRVQLEQTPDPDNRLRISSRSDRRFGVDLSLRLTEDDRRNHLKSLRIAAAVLGFDDRRLARQLALRLDAGRFGFFSHHTGTTRMSADAARGVVDADCRVHGIDNLFVCGCSVFPTVGIAPPTLTIVALALRLADHLRRAAAAER
jgi:choline dehydrogenase-like flavoprotein